MSTMIAETTLPSGQIIQLVHGDLTEEAVDAIVNAANAQLAHGGGVAGAIVRRGGEEIQEESDAWIREHGAASHTKPAITQAGSLPCRFIIHAVGPRWGEGNEDTKLHQAVSSSLMLASERAFSSLAMPAISTGIFGFPKARGARVILDAVVDFFQAYPQTSLQEIHITLIDEFSVQSFVPEFERRWPGSVKSV